MDELLQTFNNYGLHPKEIIPDGKIHRFSGKSKNSAWYVIHQNHSISDGEPYFLGTFGDWGTNDTYEYRPRKKLTRTELNSINTKIHENAKKQAVERIKLQEEVSEFAEELWALGRDSYSAPYSGDKGLDGLYGAKTILGRKGRELMVSCRDSDGKLWGVQKIQPDGFKPFMSGQRIRGTFFTIGEIINGETIYICEGYSTGVSIHMAIKKTVVCAFNAGNLKSVALAIKEKNNESPIVICGDDDLWTKDADGNPKNPGRNSGTEASEAVLGLPIFPRFKNLEKQPTDFNDLMVQEGLEEVRSQIMKEKPDSNFVLCLGHKDQYYFYTSSSNKQIVKFARSEHTEKNLTDLMALEYWESIKPGKNGADWKAIDNYLKLKCRARGFFDEKIVRGTGVWTDTGKTVMNLGDGLFINGERQPYESIKSDHIYSVGNRIKAPSEEILSLSDRTLLLEVTTRLSWARDDYGKLLAGWLVIAPICGVLDWRPHIWISGPSTSGKSWTMNHIVSTMLGGLGEFFSGATTEAGIRQTMRSDCRPITFDEFETNDKTSGERVKAVLELFRNSSSDDEARVAKGTVSGLAMSFRSRFAGCVGSIRPNLTEEADKNRFCVMELEKGKRTKEHFAETQLLAKKLKGGYNLKLFGSTLQNLDAILTNIKTFKNLLYDDYGPRFGDQYGTLLGGYTSLMTDKKITEVEAKGIISTFHFKVEYDESDDSDENDCLAFMLESTLRTETGMGLMELSIIEYIRGQGQSRGFKMALERHGIVYDGGSLYIANKNANLMKLMARTKWMGGWSRSLRRIKGADNNENKTIRFNGSPCKCTRIPYEIN